MFFKIYKKYFEIQEILSKYVKEINANQVMHFSKYNNALLHYYKSNNEIMQYCLKRSADSTYCTSKSELEKI